LQGSGAIRCPDGESRRVVPGSLVIVPRGAEHDLESEGELQHDLVVPGPRGAKRGAELEKSELYIPTAPNHDPAPRIVAGTVESTDLIIACGLVRAYYGPSLGLFDHLRELLFVDPSDSLRLMPAFEGILEEQAQADPGSDAVTSALMTQCLVRVLRKVCEESDCPLPWLAVVEDIRLARAVDLILKDPGGNHSVDLLAEVAAMSRSAFSERFTAAFGLPPMSLVHHIRMQRAARLLRQGGQSIDEVAGRVGFSSRSHFSRAFKAHTGHSPAAFREAVH
jgi:AraC-like DNA-binding protein